MAIANARTKKLRLMVAFSPFDHLWYWSSLTFSIQSTAFPSTCS
jgi:hypothetical protein